MSRLFCIALFTIIIFNYDLKYPHVACGQNENVQTIIHGINNLTIVVREYIAGIQNITDSKFQYEDEETLQKMFFNKIFDATKSTYPDLNQDKYEGKRNLYPVTETLTLRDTMYNRQKTKAEYTGKLRSYKTETHKVQTYDGYILKIQRIYSIHNDLPKKIIVMHHGLLGSAEDWLILTGEQCLPCLLIEHGSEVWLLNARGNKYSKAHETLNISSFQFWDFSWHEMGIFDLPAALTYIRANAKGVSLYYIGHSMGATALLVLLTSFPEYNDYLKFAFFLAPLAYMCHTKGPLKYFNSYYEKGGIVSEIAEVPREFITLNSDLDTVLQKEFCKGSYTMCSNPRLLIADGGKTIEDDDLMANIVSHVPGGGSTKTLIHYMQLMKHKRFRRYDYGLLVNLKTYGLKYPPLYNLTAIRLPMIMFSSTSDWLANTADVIKLVTKVNSVKRHQVIRDENFGHFDFLWSKSARHLVFYPIIDALEIIEEMNWNRFPETNNE